jgi:hypothetical protein
MRVRSGGVMRGSYEVCLLSAAGEQRVRVRASSRSDACRVTAAAHPGRSFVVIGLIRDGAIPQDGSGKPVF